MTLIYFILVLSITIFVHELGHFIFAKKAGIYVYEFCVGMGPRIFKWTRKNDETEYGIRLFPIGGFCSMAGESVEVDEKVPVDRRLQSKTWLQKFLTVVAGVMFNFIFAIFVFFIVGLFNGNPDTTPVIMEVDTKYPAYAAGLVPGDIVTKVNGVKVNNIDDFKMETIILEGENLDLEVLRDNAVIEISISPIEENGDYLWGFKVGVNGEVETGLLGAVKYTFTHFISLIKEMFLVIGYLVTGKLSLNSLSGPIGIYNIVGQTAESGLLDVIHLIGYLSINVGFINLLPLPAFDGGRILFLIIEKIFRKPIKPSVENIIHSVGFVLLMILMIIITFNDILRFIIK